MIDIRMVILCLSILEHTSINQSIYLYSASSRYLLRGAPEPGLIKKESLEVLVKRSRGDTRGGSEVKRKIIPKDRTRNWEGSWLSLSSAGKRDKKVATRGRAQGSACKSSSYRDKELAQVRWAKGVDTVRESKPGFVLPGIPGNPWFFKPKNPGLHAIETRVLRYKEIVNKTQDRVTFMIS